MRIRRICTGVLQVAILVALTTTVRADSTLGLTSYWPFDEAGGTVAHDNVGPFDAPLTGTAAFVNDPTRGQVLSPGSGSALINGANPLNKDSGTIMVWANLNNTSGYNQFFESVDYSVGSEPRFYLYSLEGTFKIGLGTNSAYFTSGTFDTGNWHQIALAWQASSPGASGGEFTAYMDGVPVQGTTYAGLTSLGSYASLGSTFYPPNGVQGSSVKGTLSDFGIWNRALTDQEVLDLYQAGHILAPAVPGDINGDGQVNLTDYGILKSSFFQTVAAGTSGDLNGDSKVDLTDFVIFKNDYQNFNGGSAAAVPEPAALVLVASILPAWMLLRRRTGRKN